MKKLLALLFLLAALGSDAQQLTQTIRGTVTDKETNEELVGASVVLLNSEPLKGTMTDATGVFRLEKVPVGRHSVRITYVGYKPMVLPDIIVNSAKEVVLKITLEEDAVKGEEVVVTAKTDPAKTNNELVMISGRSFTIDQTQRYAGGLGDPSRMAANFAGVAGGGNDQRNDIVIRGNSPLGLLWRLEGVDIPNPNHFGNQGANGGPVSILNNNTLANSDFITGAFPSEYGNALSGVFDLKMRDGNNEKREFTGQIGFSGIEFMAEGPIQKSKSSYMVTYRYSTLDFLNALGLKFGASGAPRWQDLSAKVNFGKTKLGNFSMFFIGGISGTKIQDSKLSKEELAKLADRQDIDFSSKMMAGGLVHTMSLGKTAYIKTVLSISGESNTTQVDSVSPEATTFSTFNRTNYLWRNALHSFVNKKISASHSLKIGMIGTRFIAGANDSFASADSIVGSTTYYSWTKEYDYSNKQMYLGQVYANWNWKINKRMVLNSGLHYNYFFYNGSKSLEPRVAFRYALSEKRSLSFGYGRHSQMQPAPVYFALTYLNPQRTQSIESNKNLGFTKSNHFVVGYEHLINQNLRFKTEAYYQYLTDIPVTASPSYYSTVNFGADFGFPNVDSLVNKGLGQNYGIEFTLERFFNKGYYFLATTSFYQSEYKASDDKWRNTAFNGSYVVNGLFGKEYKVGSNSVLNLNIRATYAGGRRYLPVDRDESMKRGYVVYDEDHAYQNRLKDFFRTDFRISYKKNGKRVTQEWAIDIQNMFNIHNVLTQQYNPKTGEMRTLYQIGIFPVPFYRIQF